MLVRLLGHCRLGLGLVMGFLVGRVQGFLRIPFGFETAWRSGQEFSMRGRGENLCGLGEDRGPSRGETREKGGGSDHLYIFGMYIIY